MGGTADDPGLAPGSDDPVRRRRANVQRAVTVAGRTGYGLLAVAVVVFFVALATEFNGTMAAIVVASLIAASILLAPAIILGYAVKAAEREDRELGL